MNDLIKKVDKPSEQLAQKLNESLLNKFFKFSVSSFIWKDGSPEDSLREINRFEGVLIERNPGIQISHDLCGYFLGVGVLSSHLNEQDLRINKHSYYIEDEGRIASGEKKIDNSQENLVKALNELREQKVEYTYSLERAREEVEFAQKKLEVAKNICQEKETEFLDGIKEIEKFIVENGGAEKIERKRYSKGEKLLDELRGLGERNGATKQKK